MALNLLPAMVALAMIWRGGTLTQNASATDVAGPHRRSTRVRSRRWLRPSVPMTAFALLAIVVALAGGSARQDVQWLLVLRPVAVLCIVATLLTSRPDLRAVRPLGLLLGLFALTIAVQLVPLPSKLWHGLPGRDTTDLVAGVLGGNGLWHPLAMAPDLALNSLLALIVPAGVLVSFSSLREHRRLSLLSMLLALVAASILLGVAQAAGGDDSSLYWYPLSIRGQLSGLFANRNHQGALLAAALPLIRAWTFVPDVGNQTARTHVFLGLAATIVLYVLVLGSRSGVVLTGCGLVAAFLIQPSLGAGIPRRRWLLAGAVVLGIAGLFALTLVTGRSISFGRFTDNDLRVEGRLLALPTLLRILGQTLPWGTGFGSFVPVYASYEPDALLSTSYFNNAHDDLIELAITGGVPALAVLCAFLIWWGKAAWTCFTSRSPGPQRAVQRASALAIAILLLASLSDYPLRTPLMGMVFTLLCCWLAMPQSKRAPEPGRTPPSKRSRAPSA